MTFDLIARFYPLLELTVFGTKLSRARRFFISRVTDGNKILLIGEGNGRFLLEASKQISSGSVTVVDSSAGMLAAAARRIATLDRGPQIELVHADILEWRLPATNYDRIVTHFFLDLFPPDRLRRVIEKISRLATDDALWINVDFTSEDQCLRQRLLMWAQYCFFRISAGIEASRLFDPRPHLQEAGWQVLEVRTLDSGWVLAHLMDRVKSQPSTGSPSPSSTSPVFLRELMASSDSPATERLSPKSLMALRYHSRVDRE